MQRTIELVSKYTNEDITLNKGYYQVWQHDPKNNNWEAVWGYTIQDFKEATYNPLNNVFGNEDKKIKLKTSHNYYITRNPMRTSKKGRSSEELRGFSKLVIDIDRKAHSEPKTSYYNDSKEVIWAITRDLIETNEIPAPSRAVFSGRGLQLHYDFDQVAPFAVFAALIGNVIDNISDKINHTLKDHNLEEAYEVDKTASNNHAGLIRLGGLNQKSLEQVRYIEYGNHYDLNYLLKYFKIGNKPQKKIRRPNVSLKAIDLNNGRINRLEQIQASRIASNRYVGYRNKLVFLYFNSLVGLNQDNALGKVYQFNNKFPSPIPESEIKAMERYLNDVGHLKFRSETFYNEWLQLTPEEEAMIKKTLNQKKNHSEAGIKARQKQKSKEKSYRKEKNNYEQAKRLNVLKDNSTTNKEKAQLLNVSISTIQRLKRQYKDLL